MEKIHSEASTPLPSTESNFERRRHPRYKAKEGALVAPVAPDRKYWKMLDVSLAGMSFRCMTSEDLSGFSEIDIVTQDLEFALEGIPFKVISYCELADGSTDFPDLRRCGVGFGPLTPLQESHLAEFIQRYTLPQEIDSPNQVAP